MNNLCLKVIRQNEGLESSLNVKSDTANIVAHNNGKMTGKCFTCGKAGHRRFDCKSKPLNDTNSQRHHSNVKTKPHFKNRFDRRARFINDKSIKRRHIMDGKRGHKNFDSKRSYTQSNKTISAEKSSQVC